MVSSCTLLLAAACYIVPAIAGPPSNDAVFPSTLSDCGGEYIVGVANSSNQLRCNDWNDGIGANDDQQFVLFDAYYNGSMNLHYTPVGSDTSMPYLATINASLAIGQMNLASNSQISRSKWDANNFFMQIIPYYPKCPSSQTCAPWFETESSSSLWYWSQAWTMIDTKNGDGYDISGTMNKTHAMYGQGSYFAFPSSGTQGIITYTNGDFSVPRDQIAMSGHVSATDANVTFTWTNYHDGSAPPFANLQFVFSGQSWKGGAQLVTTGIHPTTTGQAKAVKAAAPSGTSTSTSTSTSKPLATIIGAAAGGGVLILIIGLVFCCCCGTVLSCFRRNKQRSQMNQQWQQQQQQQAPPVVQYPPGQKYSAPPPPGAYAQYAPPQGPYPGGNPQY